MWYGFSILCGWDSLISLSQFVWYGFSILSRWDSLSVRRIRNWDADKKLRERGDNPAAWKTKRKEARLMFQCTIPQTVDRPGYILTCQSRPFMCSEYSTFCLKDYRDNNSSEIDTVLQPLIASTKPDTSNQ